jgi:hypothetical protein
MIRKLVPLFLVGIVLVSGLATGDDSNADKDKGDGPLRLKRKKRTTPPDAEKPPGTTEKEKEKPARKEKAREDEPLVPEDGRMGDPGEDEKEVLERISRNMRAVEEKLNNRELGEPTAQQQRDILRDIDSLIRRSDQQSGGGGGGANQPQQNDQDQSQDKQGGGQKQQQMKGGGGGGGSMRQMARNTGKRQPRQLRNERGQQKDGSGRMMARGNPQQGNNQPQPRPGQAGMNPGAGGTGPTNSREIDTQLVKDIWGHLPESLRAEMNAYSNPQPLVPRYDRLIREYYKTIAEQGRKKGD